MEATPLQNSGHTDFPLATLEIYSCNKSKIRLGRNRDGGYVIVDGFDYDVLITGGISNDVSFENDFLKKHPVPCYAFDGSVERLPIDANQAITFSKQYIGDNALERNVNLSNYFAQYDSIFLKLDIEGGEYPFINSLSKLELRKLKQIAIEFHNPFEKEKYECLQKLNQTHYLMHLHPNNFSETIKIDGQSVPKVFECTYVLKELLDEVYPSNEAIPSQLDMPNDWKKPDIELSGYPYNMQVD